MAEAASAMKRRHLIEIHEQPWCPASLRDAVTDTIAFFSSIARPFDVVRDLLFETIEAKGATRIVDLCSGAGGPWRSFQRELEDRQIQVLLTDISPNVPAAEFVNRENAYVSAHTEPVDVKAVPQDLEGFRTIFTALHHLRPEEVEELIRSTATSGRGLAAFEAQDRRVPTMLFFLSYPLLSLVASPFAKPFRISRLVWTYLIPAMPIVITLDAIVSCLRTHTPAELARIAEAAGAKAEVGSVAVPGPLPLRVTYLLIR